jgi:hypothetical protein
METSAETFTGLNGIVDCVDPMTGDICYKDRAYTGCTAGRVGSTQARLFRKRTADAISEEQTQDRENFPPEIIDCSKLLAVHPISKESDVVHSGDSGCGVFCPVPEKDGWNWVGLFVSIFYQERGRGIGLMVPQSEVFHSLKEVTGKSWKLIHS